MKQTALLCILLSLAARVYSTETAIFSHSKRELLASASASGSSSAKSDSPGGSATASVSATSTGGTAEAVASATSKAFTKVENKLVTFFKYSLSRVERVRTRRKRKDKFCKRALAVIKKKLEAVGEVVAEAYTESLAGVEIKGTGSACSESSASAQSQAKGFARIVSQAIAEASSKTSLMQAEAAVEVVSTVTATAFSNAFASACVQDEGSSTALQTSFAKAVIRPIAAVSIYVAAGLDCKEVEGFTVTKTKGTASKEEGGVVAKTESTSETEGKGNSTTTGGAGASTEISPEPAPTAMKFFFRQFQH
eukprot:g8905.t1